MSSNTLRAAGRYFRDVVLPYRGDDCLIWPFNRTKFGYARVEWMGKTTWASRVVCEVVNGPPPSPRHYAAHNCGNGHTGCLTGKHLAWKTPKENQADRVAHGTSNRGERQWLAKLNPEKVRVIRALKGKENFSATGRRFGVHAATIRSVQIGQTWAWVDA